MIGFSASWIFTILPHSVGGLALPGGELVVAIEDYLAQHNQQPKPFIWTAKAADILEKVKPGRAALHKVQSA